MACVRLMRLHHGEELGGKEALAAYRAFVFEAAKERASGTNSLRGHRGAKPEAVAAAKAADGTSPTGRRSEAGSLWRPRLKRSGIGSVPDARREPAQLMG